MIADGAGMDTWPNVRLAEIAGGVRGMGESERHEPAEGEIGEKVLFVGVTGDSIIGNGEIRDEALLARLADSSRQ